MSDPGHNESGATAKPIHRTTQEEGEAATMQNRPIHDDDSEAWRVSDAGGRRAGSSSQTLDEAARAASDLGRNARHAAQEVANDLRDAASELLEEQKERAAAAVRNLAESLHRTAEAVAPENAAVARLADRAADRLSRFSEGIEERHWNDLVADLETFARRQPALYLAGALTTGFLLARFLSPADRPTAHRISGGDVVGDQTSQAGFEYQRFSGERDR